LKVLGAGVPKISTNLLRESGLNFAIYITAFVPLDFLSDLFVSGLSYSSINTTKSYLSSLLSYEDSSVPLGQLPLVKRFMKVIFEFCNLQNYVWISWSISNVFDFIRAAPLYTYFERPLLLCNFMLSLLSGQRCQTITNLSLDNMITSDDKFIFLITEKLKTHQNRGTSKFFGIPSLPLWFQYMYCVPLQKYLEMTSELRSSCQQLLITFINPHGPVYRETVSPWTKNFMSLAGIDTSKVKVMAQ